MIRTDSLNKAAYLICMGHELASYDWVTDNLCIFQFESTTEVVTALRGYERGGRVVAKTYADCISNLKKDMHKARSTA